MSAEENKEVIQRSVEQFYNTGDLSAIDCLYSPTYRDHQSGGTLALEQFREWARGVFTGIPDLKIIIHDLHVDGDMVTKRWTAKGTHKGEYLGVPAWPGSVGAAMGTRRSAGRDASHQGWRRP